MTNIKPIKIIPFSVMLVALLCAEITNASDHDINIRVQTGNISAVAIGDQANASANIGGNPNHCRNISVKHDNIHRIAVGRDATATVIIGNKSFNCEEKRR